MTPDIDRLLEQLQEEETTLLTDCQNRFERIGRIVTVESFCLEIAIRLSDQITREHERILDHIDRITQIKAERVAANTTKNSIMRLERKNET